MPDSTHTLSSETPSHLPEQTETSLVPTRVLRHLYSSILRYYTLAQHLSYPAASRWQIAEITAATCARKHDQLVGAGEAARLACGESLVECVRHPRHDEPNRSAELALQRSAVATDLRVEQIATIKAVTSKLRAEDSLVFALMGNHFENESFRRALQICGPSRLPVLFFVETKIDLSASKKANHKSEALRSIYAEFGVPVMTTDIHDPIGLYRVTTEAIHNARFGRGATVIETAQVNASGRKMRLGSLESPLEFVRSYMEARDLWNEDWAMQQRQQAIAELDSAHAMV